MREQGFANPQELAEATGMPYNTLYRWVNGRTNPHRRNLVAMLRALELDPADYGFRSAPAPTPLGADEAPAWFSAFEVRLMAKLEQQADVNALVLEALDVLRARRA